MPFGIFSCNKIKKKLTQIWFKQTAKLKKRINYLTGRSGLCGFYRGILDVFKSVLFEKPVPSVESHPECAAALFV